MRVDQFLEAVDHLTGSAPKEVSAVDRECLSVLLGDDGRSIDCSQFNEMLLLVNKDRVEAPFFEFFFRPKPTVGKIPRGVERFQKAAMLLYGNFIHGYRKLSRITDGEEFTKELCEVAFQPREELRKLRCRRRKLLNIRLIRRNDTFWVGYTLAPRVAADRERCSLLLQVLDRFPNVSGWGSLTKITKSLSKSSAHRPILSVIENFRNRDPEPDVSDFKPFLRRSLKEIDRSEQTLRAVQEWGVRNQDVYLTWDHMDVYFATSMRSEWEFVELYDFIKALMARPELRGLRLRYFDPTQSYTPNPQNKGLIEALMLKRAKCTVYSVQDVDTLGKDSEMAATLAQGKPVIAYAADVNVPRRTDELMKQDPKSLLERLAFVQYADEAASRDIAGENIKSVRFLEECTRDRIWQSVPGERLLGRLCSDCEMRLERICRIIASAEKRVYDRRADVLRRLHPLAIQVNLDTGVANGVLVVRSIHKCARLLRRILTYSLEFDIEQDDDMWYLRERLSGCVYRVVTKNEKLTNCFWNFYLGREKRGGGAHGDIS